MPASTPEHMTHLYPDVTGLILAGGKSQRMGQDKANLIYQGRTLFERTLEVLQPLFPSVVIAGDRPDLIRPGLICLPDIYPGSALGGLYTGLFHAPTPFVFAIACDMPLIFDALIREVVSRRKGYDAVVPGAGSHLEPLFSVYHKNCLAPIQEMLEGKQFCILDIFSRVRTRYINLTDYPEEYRNALANINTPAQFRHLRERNG